MLPSQDLRVIQEEEEEEAMPICFLLLICQPKVHMNILMAYLKYHTFRRVFLWFNV